MLLFFFPQFLVRIEQTNWITTGWLQHLQPIWKIMRKSNWIISLGIEVKHQTKTTLETTTGKTFLQPPQNPPSTVLVPKKSKKKKNGWKAANLAKIFRHRSWTVSASPRCSWHFRDAMIRGQKVFRTQISCTMRGKIPDSCLHICIVIPSKWRANLRIPDDSAMFVVFNVGIFSCLFDEGIRDFLWSWPRLVPLHSGVLLLRCLLHPGKWTAGTQQWRFGSNDVPFKFSDFNALVVEPTHLKHMLVKLDRLPR